MAGGKYSSFFRTVLFIAFIIVAVWLSFCYLLPWTLPFIFAFLTAALIEPAVSLFSTKLCVRRGFASAACSLMIIGIIITLISLIIMRIIYEAASLSGRLPELISGASSLLSAVMEKIDGGISSAPAGMREFLYGAASSVSGAVSSWAEKAVGAVLGFLSGIASSTPRIFLAVITYIIGVFFISGSYPNIKSFVLRQFPDSLHPKLRSFKADIISTLASWIRAQLKIMVVTFSELTLGFLLMRIPYALLLAAIVSVIDALPVFGVGTVLIPWAIVELLGGNTPLAVMLAVLYGVITLVRSFIEPRIVGKNIGLHPAAMLLTMYVGFCAFGICGMVLFPISSVLLKQLNDKGYVKLWKT